MFHTAGHNKKILNSFLCAGYANGQKDSCEVRMLNIPDYDKLNVHVNIYPYPYPYRYPYPYPYLLKGDSGGPLVLKRVDGRYELAGTVSHGIKCAAPYLPGVYMRTSYYKPWLRGITGVK